jgi:hypothetical protein
MASIHDPLFDVPVRPMFRWGASPFHMRGAIYRDTITMAERLVAKRGRRLAEVLQQHGDPQLGSFMAQRFSPTDWYDIYPAIHFAPIVARASGITHAQHMRDSAVAHAEWALRGFTGVILKLLSSETVAMWLPRISAWYHDFGSIETRTVGERHVRGLRTGLPVFVVQGWSVLGMHFTEYVLAHSGAKEPRAHALDAEPDGTRDGCPLYRVTFEARWAE